MKTLEQWNKDRRAAYKTARMLKLPHANGIECPKCGGELWDSDPCVTLASNPPQKNVHCPECGHRGYRLA
jgi:DNA-directed RNA polymerase subunit RPC12/RpoP